MKKIIHNGLLITMNKNKDVIADGAVYIVDSNIVALGKSNEILEAYDDKDAEKIDAKESVIMPGLVCNHIHLFQNLFRGISDSSTLLNWVASSIFPLSEYLNEDKSYTSAMLSIMELIRTGTTCLADSHYMHINKRNIDGIAKAIGESGIRGVLVRTAINSPMPGMNPAFFEDLKTVEDESVRCIKLYNNAFDGRMTVSLEALGDGICDEEMIKHVHEIAMRHKVGFHMHVSEIASMRSYKGKRSIEFLNDIGVLGPNTLLAHCVWVTPREQRILAETGTKIAHNPVSNMMLGDGIAPILEMKELGVDIGIGVDGAASNNSQDMFEAMKICLLQHRTKWLDAEVITPEDVLEMATIGSAKTLGLDSKVGSIESGKKADIIILSEDSLQMTPNLRPISNIVLSANGLNVDTVLVNGEILMKNKTFTVLDKKKIIKSANEMARELVEKAGMKDHLTRGRFNYI